MKRAVMLFAAVACAPSASGAPKLADLEEQGRLALVSPAPDVAKALTALAEAMRGGRDTATLRLLIGMGLALRAAEPVELGRHDAPIVRVVASASGARVASLDSAGKVRVWDVPGRRLLHELTTVASFAAFAGDRLVTVGDGKARLWLDDEETELDDAVALALRPDGSVVAVASSGGRIAVWDLRSVRRIAAFSAGGKPVTLRLHPNRPMLAALDGTHADVRDFDGKRLAVMPARELEFLPGAAALIHEDSRAASLWDIDLWLPGKNGNRRALVGAETDLALYAAAARLRGGGAARPAPLRPDRLADGRTLEIRDRVRVVIAPPLAKVGDVVEVSLGADTVPAPRGNRIIGMGKMFDASRGAQLYTFPGFKWAFAPDGTTFASVEKDRTLWLWRAEDGARLRQLEADPAIDGDAARDVAFSADGAWTVVAAYKSAFDGPGPRRSRVRVWDLRAGKMAAEHALPGEQVIFARPTPDARRLVVWSVREDGFPPSGPGTLRILDLTGNGTRLERDGRGAAISADGSVAALVRDGGAIELLGTGGKALATVSSTEVPVLSPDGSRVALFGKDTLDVTVCDTATGRVLWTAPGGSRYASGDRAAFSPDGAYVATFGDSGLSVRLWEASSGRLLGSRRLSGPAWYLVVGPGPYVATARGASLIWRPVPFGGTSAELDRILK